MRVPSCLIVFVALLALTGSSDAAASPTDTLAATPSAPPNPPSGPLCPHFVVQDGDDADTEPDHIPTTPKDGECLLRRDVVGLVRPLRLASGVRLDCQDHQILPSAAGRPNDPLTPQFDPVFSQPQLAFFLRDVEGIAIRNCRIGSPGDYGFDFGILAVNSKSPTASGSPRSQIVDNEIHASYGAVHLIASDDFDIESNRIVYFVQGGTAVHLEHGSQGNTVESNDIVGDLRASGALAVPGPTDLDASGVPVPCLMGGLCTNSNPVVGVQTAAVVVTQVLGAHPQLWNAIIEGELHQFTFASSTEVNEDFTADNTIESNDISFEIAPSLEAGSRESGVAAVGSLRTFVRGNDVTRPSGIGIRDGQIAEPRLFPGKCSFESTRHCLADDDCSIPGVDDVAKGTCVSPPPQVVDAEWFARDFRIEDNDVQGPFRGGISIAAEGSRVRGNRITGPLIAPQGLGGIVVRGKFGLETAVVVHNRVANVSTALRLDKTLFGVSASSFDAIVSHNDFTGYTIAVQTTGNYDLLSELSADGSGNHWGLTCVQGGFDPTKVVELGGTVNPSVTDSHPYGEAIAGTPEEDLPPTCF
jgi:hypothetical protein